VFEGDRLARRVIVGPEEILGSEIENRRKEIAEDARKSMAAFRAGELQPQPVGEIIDDLRESAGTHDEVY
jgi:5,10-methenyltetrahydromethanopterin hydrogenase